MKNRGFKILLTFCFLLLPAILLVSACGKEENPKYAVRAEFVGLTEEKKNFLEFDIDSFNNSFASIDKDFNEDITISLLFKEGFNDSGLEITANGKTLQHSLQDLNLESTNSLTSSGPDYKNEVRNIVCSIKNPGKETVIKIDLTGCNIFKSKIEFDKETYNDILYAMVDNKEIKNNCVKDLEGIKFLSLGNKSYIDNIYLNKSIFILSPFEELYQHKEDMIHYYTLQKQLNPSNPLESYKYIDTKTDKTYYVYYFSDIQDEQIYLSKKYGEDYTPNIFTITNKLSFGTEENTIYVNDKDLKIGYGYSLFNTPGTDLVLPNNSILRPAYNIGNLFTYIYIGDNQYYVDDRIAFNPNMGDNKPRITSSIFYSFQLPMGESLDDFSFRLEGEGNKFISIDKTNIQVIDDKTNRYIFQIDKEFLVPFIKTTSANGPTVKYGKANLVCYYAKVNDENHISFQLSDDTLTQDLLQLNNLNQIIQIMGTPKKEFFVCNKKDLLNEGRYFCKVNVNHPKTIGMPDGNIKNLRFKINDTIYNFTYKDYGDYLIDITDIMADKKNFIVTLLFDYIKQDRIATLSFSNLSKNINKNIVIYISNDSTLPLNKWTRMMSTDKKEIRDQEPLFFIAYDRTNNKSYNLEFQSNPPVGRNFKNIVKKQGHSFNDLTNKQITIDGKCIYYLSIEDNYDYKTVGILNFVVVDC